MEPRHFGIFQWNFATGRGRKSSQVGWQSGILGFVKISWLSGRLWPPQVVGYQHFFPGIERYIFSLMDMKFGEAEIFDLKNKKQVKLDFRTRPIYV